MHFAGDRIKGTYFQYSLFIKKHGTETFIMNVFRTLKTEGFVFDFFVRHSSKDFEYRQKDSEKIRGRIRIKENTTSMLKSIYPPSKSH